MQVAPKIAVPAALPSTQTRMGAAALGIQSRAAPNAGRAVSGFNDRYRHERGGAGSLQWGRGRRGEELADPISGQIAAMAIH